MQPAEIETLTDDELNRWWALSLVDDWGGEWRRTAAVCCEIYNASVRIVQAVVAVSGKSLRQMPEYKEAAEFEPRFRWERKTKGRKVQTADEQFDVLRGMLK